MTKICVKCVKLGTKKALHLPLQTSKSHEVTRVSGENMSQDGSKWKLQLWSFLQPGGARTVPVEFRVI